MSLSKLLIVKKLLLAALAVSVCAAGITGVVGWRDARGGAPAQATVKPGVWGLATPVNGVDTPSNLGGNVGYPGTDLGLDASVSCASPGNCSAGISTGTKFAVAGESHGTWGAATQLPGMAALDIGGDGQIAQVSCAAAGSCSLGGFYSTGPKNSSSSGRTAFVADESSGTWGAAQQVPGLSSLNAGNNAQVFSVSCAAAGSCAAGGSYDDSSGSAQAFLADEVNGAWRPAQEVPGAAELNTGRAAEVDTVSCPAPGDCAALGTYQDGWPATTQLFAVNEVNGSWGVAQKVPGAMALNAGGNAYVASVSCAAPGDCSAVGSYADAAKRNQAFVVDEVHGSWGAAQEAPGTAALNVGGPATLDSVSCTAPGDCSAGGSYTDAAKQSQPFVVDEVHGSWRTAQETQGTAALNVGGSASVDSVSCTAPGDCGAGGAYMDDAGHGHPFLLNEVSGRWKPAQQVPGIAALKGKGNIQIDSVSCTAPAECSAIGDYEDSSGDHRAFAVTETAR